MPSADLALLALRLAAGLVFAAHGAQKVFGWWGGQGLSGWRGTIEKLGYRPAGPFSLLGAFVELGGVAIAVGFLTPVAAFLALGQSVVIVVGIHGKRGFWNRDNGFEFPLVLGTGFLAVLLAGPGAFSVDALLGIAVGDDVRAALAVIALVGGLGVAILPRLTAPLRPAA